MARVTLNEVYSEVKGLHTMLQQVREGQQANSRALRKVEEALHGNGEPGFKTRLALLEKSVAERETMEREKKKARVSFNMNMIMFVIQSLLTIFIISKLAAL